MSAEGSVKDEEKLEVLFEQEEIESSEEPPEEEWSSLLCWLAAPQENEKQRLFEEGLYEPPSEEICAKYIPLSDSSVFRHPYYNYPSVKDPGIEDALLLSPRKIIYADDGQELYLALCKEMNECPCRRFYRQLLENEVNLSYYGISPLGFRPMAMALRQNRNVKTVNLTDNFISSDGCFHFGDILSDNFTITELNFCGCRMGPEGIRRLVYKMHKNKTLKTLNLSKNVLADEGAEMLASALYKGAGVANLDLSINKLTSKTATFLAEALEFTNNITHLNLSWNTFAVPRPVEIMVDCFVDSDKLVEVNFSWNSLSNRFAKALCNLLSAPNLRVLDLNNNNLCGDAVAMLTDKIKQSKSLEVFNISFNPLTVADAKQLLRCLGFRKVKVKSLLMDGVYVDELFVKMKMRVLGLKFRKDAEITHGYVVPKIAGIWPDIRELAFKRAQAVCEKPKKKRVDVGVMILQVCKELNGQPIFSKQLLSIFKAYGAFQLNEDLVEAMCAGFPGPRKGKIKLTDIREMADFVHRIWPEAEAPPTPPPPPPPPPPAPPAKGKKDEKGKKGKKK